MTEAISPKFFSYVDVDLRPEGEGVSVTYAVRENPVIESISFTGNTVYTNEVLLCPARCFCYDNRLFSHS